MPEPQVELSAAGPVDDERQQDDGQDDDHQPEEEDDDAGNRVPGYGSCSSHRRQLPAAASLIPRPGLTTEQIGQRANLLTTRENVSAYGGVARKE